jgi:hypothetical protein
MQLCLENEIYFRNETLQRIKDADTIISKIFTLCNSSKNDNSILQEIIGKWSV